MRIGSLLLLLSLALASGPRPAHASDESHEETEHRLKSAGIDEAMRGSSLVLLSLQFVSAWAAAAASNPTAAAPRLKVLCMHGYSQNGAVLRDRSGGFRKPFKKSRFEMSYPDGLFGCTKTGFIESAPLVE